MFDSLELAAGSLLAKDSIDKKDELIKHYAVAYIAQAKLLQGKNDSIDRYLNLLPDDYDEDYFLSTLIDNIIAIHAMTVTTDYGRAMLHLKRAEARLESQKDTTNQVFVLCNITSLYVSRQDTMGLKYAVKAYDLSHVCQTNKMTAAMSALMMARIYQLKQDYTVALRYADEGAELIETLDNKGLEVASASLYGELYCNLRKFELAKFYCEKALKFTPSADVSTQLNLLLSYGKVLREMKHYAQAIAILEQGRKLSEEKKNLSFSQAFLTLLADLYYQQQHREAALNCYRAIYDHSQTLYSFNKEREFTNLQIELSEMSHQLKMHQQELHLAKVQRRETIIVAVLFICIMLTLAGYFVYNKKNKMYRQLVIQHQALLKKINDIKQLEQVRNRADVNTDKDVQLFEKLENLMHSERVYCQSDISLEKLSAMLNTNKTYVSSVINNYAKMSFYEYINAYRIERAIAMLRNLTDDTLIKTLAYDLGYNSLSAFYRAFKNATGCSPSHYKEGLIYIGQESKKHCSSEDIA
ncbi:MAG: helix-turn-helix domain-containing protein [Alistipes sp.]